MDHELERIDSIQEQLENFYAGRGNLTAETEARMERVELAFGLLVKHRNKASAAAQMVRISAKSGDKPITLRTAYRDLDLAEKVILPLQKVSKESHRLMVINSALRDIRKAEKHIKHGERDWYMTEEHGEMVKKTKKPFSPKEIQGYMKIKDLAERRIIEAAGLKDNSEIPDFSKLEPHTYEMQMPDDMREMLSALSQLGSFDVSKFQQFILANSEDIDYESAD